MKIDKKNMYFLLLGIGAGMLLTSLLNIVNPRTEYVQYTDEQIKQKATELGMVSIKDVISENKELKEEISSVKSQTEEIPGEDDSINKALEADEDKQQHEETEVISFVIDKGENSEEIVDKLYDKGIIDDKEAFSDLIIEKGVQRRFIYGKYEIIKGIDYESLIGMLTKN